MVLAASRRCRGRRFSQKNRFPTRVSGPGARRGEPSPHLPARSCAKSAEARCNFAIAEMSFSSTPRAKFMLNSLNHVRNTCIANLLTQVWGRTPPKITKIFAPYRSTQGAPFFGHIAAWSAETGHFSCASERHMSAMPPSLERVGYRRYGDVRYAHPSGNLGDFAWAAKERIPPRVVTEAARRARCAAWSAKICAATRGQSIATSTRSERFCVCARACDAKSRNRSDPHLTRLRRRPRKTATERRSAASSAGFGDRR